MREKQGKSQLEIDFRRLSLNVRWNTILVPFEQFQFIELLPEKGYNLDSKIQELRSAEFFEVGGLLGYKGSNTKVTMNQDHPGLILDEKDPQILVKEFEALEQLLDSHLSFKSVNSALFYELYAVAAVKTNQDPLTILRKCGRNFTLTSRFAELTGFGPATNISFRLAPVEGEVHSSTWWDFYVEPSFRSPHSLYRFRIVYRCPERQSVLKFATDVKSIISNFIGMLEESCE